MVGALKDLSPVERERVAAAVAAAQARTGARFSLAVVHASDRYRLYPVLWGAGLSLAALGVIAIVSPQLNVRLAFAAVTAIFVIASFILEWQPLRLMIVAKRVKHDHARALAHREFAVRVLSHPDRKGGVLFFVSLAERYVEIIADHALHQAAGQEAWDAIVREFTNSAAHGHIAEGFIASADACGAILAAHRPAA